jgi:hypothetical protein
MAMNPMQQQMSPDMLMAMMTDPRASPQQRMAAMSALNALKGGANAPAPPPQMTGDSTGVSTIDPAFMAAVRQEVMGQGPEEQPEIQQRQAAPEAPQDSTTQALMSGAADASRVAAMAHGGAVRGYKDGEKVTKGRPSLSNVLEEELLADENNYLGDYLRGARRLGGDFAPPYKILPRGPMPPLQDVMRRPPAPMQGFDMQLPPAPEVNSEQSEPMPPLRDVMRRPPAPMQRFDVQLPPAPEVNIDQSEPAPTAGQEKPARTGGKDYYALLEKMAEEGDDGEASKKDKYMALLQAGLGTMAAASQPGAKFLGSIGQGGLMGVEGLQQARAERAQDRMKKMTLYGTLAGRQDASDARADALEQAKVLAGEKLRQDQEQFERADETDRLIAQGQIAARMSAIDAANVRAAERAADKIEGENRTKAADRREYALRLFNWQKSGGLFPELPDDKLNGFINPQGTIDEAEESTKPLVTSKLTPFVLQTKLKTEASKAEGELIESYRTLMQAVESAKELKDMPGKSAAIGSVLGSPYQKIFSTESGAFRTDLDQFNAKLKEVKSGKVIGDLVSQRQNSPRGSSVFGQLTEKELETAMSSGTSLDPKLGDEFDDTLDRHISNLESRANVLKRQWTQHYGELPKEVNDYAAVKTAETEKAQYLKEVEAELARREKIAALPPGR